MQIGTDTNLQIEKFLGKKGHHHPAMGPISNSVTPPCNINVNALMTDDDNVGWNSFSMVIGPTPHFLCKWHLHRAWSRKLRKLFPGNSTLQAKFYQLLVVLMEEKNSNTFQNQLHQLTAKYSMMYPDLFEYLETYYFNRTEKWAMCYRNFPHAETDTNMFLESYHNRLKTFYMKRKKNKRIDDLLNLLLHVEEEDFWRHKTETFFAGPTEQNSSDCRHQRGMKIPKTQVCNDNPSQWRVLSQTKKKETYIVRKVADSCSWEHCFSKCLEVSCAGLCAHIYSCSCPDKSD